MRLGNTGRSPWIDIPRCPYVPDPSSEADTFFTHDTMISSPGIFETRARIASGTRRKLFCQLGLLIFLNLTNCYSSGRHARHGAALDCSYCINARFRHAVDTVVKKSSAALSIAAHQRAFLRYRNLSAVNLPGKLT